MPTPDYQPATVIGEEWTRAYQIVVDNRLNAVPEATFFEERAMLTDSGENRHWATGHCRIVYDEAAEIPILDPATGEATGGTITFAALYGLLYSAYLYAATQGDQAGQVLEEPAAPES